MTISGQVPKTVTRGTLTIDILSSQAFYNGVDLLLTQKECALLLLLTEHENRAMSADYLYEKVWGQPANNDASAVKHQISNLRKKLEGCGCGYTVASSRGEGYTFKKE